MNRYSIFTLVTSVIGLTNYFVILKLLGATREADIFISYTYIMFFIFGVLNNFVNFYLVQTELHERQRQNAIALMFFFLLLSTSATILYMLINFLIFGKDMVHDVLLLLFLILPNCIQLTFSLLTQTNNYSAHVIFTGVPTQLAIMISVLITAYVYEDKSLLLVFGFLNIFLNMIFLLPMIKRLDRRQRVIWNIVHSDAKNLFSQGTFITLFSVYALIEVFYMNRLSAGSLIILAVIHRINFTLNNLFLAKTFWHESLITSSNSDDEKKDLILKILRKLFVRHLALLVAMSCVSLLFAENAFRLLKIDVSLINLQGMTLFIFCGGLFMSLSSVMARIANQVNLPVNIISTISIVAYVAAAEALTNMYQEIGMALSYVIFWFVFFVASMRYFFISTTPRLGDNK